MPMPIESHLSTLFHTIYKYNIKKHIHWRMCKNICSTIREHLYTFNLTIVKNPLIVTRLFLKI